MQEAKGEQESGGRYADEAAHALLGLCSCYHERPVLNQYRPPALAPAANHTMLTDLATTPCLAAEVALDRIPALLGKIAARPGGSSPLTVKDLVEMAA